LSLPYRRITDTLVILLVLLEKVENSWVANHVKILEFAADHLFCMFAAFYIGSPSGLSGRLTMSIRIFSGSSFVLVSRPLSGVTIS
jgi:hypothetical protein